VSLSSSHQDLGLVSGSAGSRFLCVEEDRTGASESPADLRPRRARCASMAAARRAYPARGGMRERDLEEAVVIFLRIEGRSPCFKPHIRPIVPCPLGKSWMSDGSPPYEFVILTKVRIQLRSAHEVKLDSGFRRNDEQGSIMSRKEQ
jgi:hypothetical protein